MPTTDIPDEKALLRRISLGDETAFTTLFNTYKDRIYTIALRLTDPLTAEEIVQDVFLKLWLKKESLPDVDHFRAYLFTATRNHVFDALKRLSTRRRLADQLARELPDDNSDTDALLLDKEYQATLREAIDRLPAQQQKVYRLIKEQGLKRDQVAEQMNIAPQTVKQHLAQAMRSIRAFCVSRLDIYIALVLFDHLHK